MREELDLFFCPCCTSECPSFALGQETTTSLQVLFRTPVIQRSVMGGLAVEKEFETLESCLL